MRMCMCALLHRVFPVQVHTHTHRLLPASGDAVFVGPPSRKPEIILNVKEALNFFASIHSSL